MADSVGLKVARDRALGPDGRSHGLAGGPPLAFYASSESHVVQRRAADMLGLGLDALRTVAVDDGRRMLPKALEEAIERDLAEGVRPAAVIGTAGTTATGAIDPLDPLAEICERHDVHFHVDACYGGPAVLADDLRPLFAGIERADSIAADAHKWLYTPLLGGCALVRDEALLGAAFAADASYIWLDEEVRRSTESTTRIKARTSAAVSRPCGSGCRSSLTAERPTDDASRTTRRWPATWASCGGAPGLRADARWGCRSAASAMCPRGCAARTRRSTASTSGS